MTGIFPDRSVLLAPVKVIKTVMLEEIVFLAGLMACTEMTEVKEKAVREKQMEISPQKNIILDGEKTATNF